MLRHNPALPVARPPHPITGFSIQASVSCSARSIAHSVLSSTSWTNSVHPSAAEIMPPISVRVWRQGVLAWFKEGVHYQKWMSVLGITCNAHLKPVESDCFWTMTPVIGISGGKLEVITADIDGPKAWSINTKALASDELHADSLLFFFNVSPPHI